jgi:hypothetical protein
MIFTPQDRVEAHKLGISLDDPPAESPLQGMYDQLLACYDHLNNECAQAHCDVRRFREERDTARWQRNTLFLLAVSLTIGGGICLLVNARWAQ